MAVNADSERKYAAQSLREDGFLVTVGIPTYASGKIASWRTTYAWGMMTAARKRNQGADAIVEHEVDLVLAAIESTSDGALTSTTLELPRNARITAGGQVLAVIDAGPVAPAGDVLLYEVRCRAGGAL